MKKKLCGAALAFAILIGLCNIPAWAAIVLASGECGAVGNDITWTLDREGLFSINGVGAMRDYANADSLPWYAYRDQIKSVEIHDGVTSVGNNAFRTCASLESVTLPESLTSIGDVAFYQCSALKAIAIPAAVETIGANAFGYCALTEVTIPANVRQIGDSAFFKCSALTAIAVDDANAVYSSKDGVLFDKLEPQEGQEETDPGFSLLICYPAAKSGGEYSVPEGVKKIGDNAFRNVVNLKKVIFPAGLTEIGQWAFGDDALLSELELPAELTTVGDNAFSGCVGLSDSEGNAVEGARVFFAGSRQQWSSLVMGAGNNRLTNSNIVFGDMKQDNIVASGECGALGSNASWSLDKDGNFLISGDGEMLNYRSAASVPWASYDDGSEEGPKDLRPDIKTVTVEGSVTRNDAGVITARRGVANVGNYAFYDCANLTAVTLPPTLTAIGAQAFSGCPLLTRINLFDTEISSIGDYALNGSSALKEIAFPETLKTIGKRAFLRSGLTSVTIPSAVEEIGEWAFRWCESMTAFTMENLENPADAHYTSIGDYALADCAALSNVSFTENLTVIGEYAFSRCAALTSVSIPSSVSGIGVCAFYNCSALTAVDVNENNQTYCSVNGMLLNKDQTCIFHYPAGRPSDSCAISQSVNSVTAFAFDGAANLKNVYYDGNQSQWDASVRPNIGAYNDPLLNAELHCEGPDPNDLSNVSSIDSFTVEATEEGRTAFVSVHCGENVLGAEALCATYDKDGRFLGIECQEVQPGTDDEISFALDEKAASLRLFIWDGNKTPRCPSETYSLQTN